MPHLSYNLELIFLSTPSARRATCGAWATSSTWEDFYPRPPRGGRLPARTSTPGYLLFLSTPSARRATQPHPAVLADVGISIHALREEGDPRRCRSGSYGIPISIHALREEGDTSRSSWANRMEMISIHALREEGDEAPHRTPPSCR